MTAPVNMTNCPSDETLAAFIDGRLDGAARDEVVAHLSSCTECRDGVNSVYEMQSEVPDRRAWLIPAATLAAAAAIATAVFLGPAGDGFRMSRNISALTAATANLKERPIQARPSIDIAYKGYTVLRSGGVDSDIPAGDLLQAASRITRIAEKNPTAANRHKAGVALLLAGYEKEAILELEEAAKEKANDPDLLNDLAAAYHDANDQKRAKETIERAWTLKKSAPIAWTRAVILWTREGWKDYLAIDPNSEWSAEARKHLD